MMRKIAFLFLFALVFQQGRSQTSAAEWPISNVAVYRQGAKIERVGRVQLDAEGTATVKISGLAKDIDIEMLQVSLAPAWSLVGREFSNEVDAKVVEQAQAAFERIAQSQSANRQTFALREALQQTYEEELAMIRANRSVGGNELLLVEDLRDHADFWRNRVKELQYMMLELRMEMRALDEDWGGLEEERLEWEERSRQERGEIRLRFAGPAGAQARVAVSYLVYDAYWSAAYDAEVAGDGTIRMNRYASVAQGTGNDWTGVPLAFLVGNPLQAIAPPIPQPKRLTLASGNGMTAYGYEWSQSQILMEDLAMDDAAVNGVSLTAGSPALERFVFEPATAVDVPGNGTKERVFIEAFELAGSLDYLLLPEYADEAYQLVNSGDWTSSRLVPGTVQVIADGIYRGSFWMQLPAPGDTLQIPLGQDPQVRSSRERLVDQCSSNLLGNSKKTTQTFEIRVENQHNRAVHVRVQDALPISQGSDIQVEPLGLGGGVLDPNTGELTWELDLAPREQRTLTFGFEVTYPKKRVLQGL